MRLKNKCHLAVLILVSVVSSKALFAAPSITSLFPTSGGVGTSVTITGANFGATQGTSAVTFNSTTATTITSWGTTSIVATVPTGATTGGVVVTVGGGASNSVNFTVAAASFTLTGSLATARMFHTATLLNSGTVLVAGGVDGFAYDTVPSAALYNPATGTFTTTGNPNSGRIFNTATLLSNGQVLVAGGSDSKWNQIGTAELYNPASGTFTFTGSLNTARTAHSATLLNNGKVLITGGWDSNGDYISSDAAGGELYDPTTGTFVFTGSLNTERDTHTATLLNDGTVLIAGGFDSNANTLSSAEIYDPVAGTFTLTGSLNIGRAVHTATLLNNGMVLIAGGYDINGNAVACAELYNPATRSFTVTGSLNTPRYDGAQGTLLNNGMVLLAGGQDNNGDTLASAELYDPATGNFTATASMNTTRQSLTTTLLNNGQVLVAAGMDFYANVLNTAEFYQPSTLIPTGLVSIAVSPSSPSISVGATQLFTATGTFSDNSTQTLASVAWTSSDSTIATIANDAGNRGNAVAQGAGSTTVSACSGSICGSTTMTVLPPSIASLSPNLGPVGASVTIAGNNLGTTGSVTFNRTTATPTSWAATSITVPVPVGATTGDVVVTVGGVASNGIIFTVQPVGFVPTSGQMATPRYGQTATQLRTGQVLIAGGMSSPGVVNSAELYTPASQTFTAATAMNVARWLHTATLLNDGTVLIAGGSDLADEETLDSAEIYNPAVGTFTLLSNTLNTARVGHTATLLNNGQVLIVGGYDPQSGLIADGELYDPPTQTFIDLGDTNAPRYGHTATKLPNGQVLIAGGKTDPTPSGAFNTAEIFDLPSQTFTPVPVPMTTPREGHAAILLNGGQVLITGGDNPPTRSLNSAEIFNPPSNSFTAVTSTMTVPRISHVMTVLNGGQVLITGGATDSGGSSTALNAEELYDSTTQTFTSVDNMISVREHQTASLLNDGTVLEAGGTDGSNIFNTAELYMTSQLNGLASIAIIPATSSIGVGAQQPFAAVGTFSDGSTRTLSSILWSSSSAAIAPISGDATNSGVTATTAQGTTTITASAAGVTGSATLTVTAPTLVSITLSPSVATIPLGANQQFTATGVYTDGSTQDLTGTATWSSSATVVVVVNSSGLVAGLFQGTATIQVNSGSVSASTQLSVAAPALVSIAVNPATATVALGTSQQYQAIGIYTDGSTQNMTTLVAWSSTARTVATVSGTGLALGASQGTTTLTATFESVAVSVPLTVGPPSLVSLSIAPDAGSLSIGTTQQLSTTGTYTDGSTQNLTASSTWASSNSNVIGVSNAGLATAVTSGGATITATSGSTSGTAVLIVTSGTTQASLNTSRYLHSSILLNNGQILVAGGINCPSAGSCTYLNSAELYTPGAGAFTNTGAMATTRSAPAVLLSTGKALVAGGYTCDGSGNCSSLISAEIYDPVAGTFSSAGTMTVARSGHTMTVLSNGTVLIAGGENCTSATSCSALQSAEIYDPNAGTFVAATGNSMSAARFGASAVLLNSGSVLIVGGFDGINLPAEAEIYNPLNGGFSGPRPSLNVPRFDASATLLNNGQVLVAGGSTCNLPGCPTNAAEIYDPVANTFTLVPTGMNVSRFSHTATLLTNGQVVIAGGFSACSSTCTSEASAELFDPVAGVFSAGQSFGTALAGQTGTLAVNGNALLIGGINAGVTLAADEWYHPTSLTPPGLVSVSVTPASVFLAPGQTQQLVATGTFNDGNKQTLQSVIWTSSNPPAAAVSNSLGTAGLVNAQTTGTTVITATTGEVGGSASLSVAVLASLAISPTNPTLTTGTGQQLTATATFSDGSTQNVTASANWCSLNSSVLVGTASGFQGFALGVTNGTGTINATFGNISASTLITVQSPALVSPPNIASVSPTVGVAGMQVTISGSGFGTTTGTVWLGSTYGTIVSWSDPQIVAAVASISTSGTVQVQESGLSSNSVPFTVNTATISNIYPASGVAGTQVTISGSGFGATQGNGRVFLGTPNGVVQSWSDTQVVAEVGLGATSGSARVLQNGVMSNAVPFTINLPHINGISPTSGTAGAALTIRGSGFGGGTSCGGGGGGGSSSGSSSVNRDAIIHPADQHSIPSNSSVWIGGAEASVTSWCNTKIVATVASDAVTGVAKVDADGVWSNVATFTVSNGGSSVTLVPNLVSMVIGESRTIQALDATEQQVTGLTWTSSNIALATLSTDDPPVITAVGAGNVTITAGNASADLTFYSGSALPLGTVAWSNPGDGSGVIGIVPAVPSATGVADVFALNSDCNAQAVTSDGVTAWTTNVGKAPQYPYYSDNPGPCSAFLPDFQGGLVAMNEGVVTQPNGQWYLQYTLQKFDGMTGQPYPAYNLGGILWSDINSWYEGFGYNTVTSYPPMVVHTDGTIFVAYNQTPSGSLVGTPVVAVIDPLTGQPKNTFFGADPSGLRFAAFGNLIVAGDGYAYLPYASFTGAAAGPPVDACGPSIGTSYLSLLRMDTGGNASSIRLGSWGTHYANCSSGTLVNPTGINVITNADQGVLVTWDLKTRGQSGQSQVYASDAYYIATTSGSSVAAQSALNIPGQSTSLNPVLQAQDGTFVGTVGVGQQTNMVAFDSSGNLKWSVANDSPQIATADGGVIGTSGTIYDSYGNANGLSADPDASWTGNTYQLGSIEKTLSVPSDRATPPYWSSARANQSSNNAAPLCYDGRDQIVAQYGQFRVGDAYFPLIPGTNPPLYPRYTPNCFNFAIPPADPNEIYTPAPANFTFANLNTSSGGAYPLIKSPLVVPPSRGYGLAKWVATYNDSRTINSAYRTPAHNANLKPNPGRPGSRHMFGDAVDLRNAKCPSGACTSQDGIQEWIQMVIAAGGVVNALDEKTVPLINTGAKASFIEPKSGPCALNCTHADWRMMDRGKYAH